MEPWLVAGVAVFQALALAGAAGVGWWARGRVADGQDEADAERDRAMRAERDDLLEERSAREQAHRLEVEHLRKRLAAAGVSERDPQLARRLLLERIDPPED